MAGRRLTSEVFLICCFFLLHLTRGVLAGQYLDTATFGHFYVFADGQILVVDPSAGAVVTTISYSQITAIPYPNNCTASPFKGRWGGVAIGPGARAIFASMYYDDAPKDRVEFLTDGVAVIDVASRSLTNRLSLSTYHPDKIDFVPLAGEIWVHTKDKGQEVILSANAPISILQTGLSNLLTSETVNADGHLITDYNLGGVAYLTTSISSGVYAVNIFNSSAAPTFISFDSVTRNAQIKCPGTLEGAFSRVIRRAFFSCVSSSPTEKVGMMEVDTVTNTAIKLWGITGDRLVFTPDDSLLLVINGKTDSIYVVQMNAVGRNNTVWSTIALTPGSTPADIVFAPKDLHYVAYISLANVDKIATIDFNQVLQCGLKCSPSNIKSFVQYQQQLGFQNPPGKPSAISKRRAISVGNSWICLAANYEGALYCSNTASSGNIFKLENVPGVQFIQFAPYYSTEPYSVLGSTIGSLDCVSIPKDIPAPPPPEDSSFVPKSASFLRLLYLNVIFPALIPAMFFL